MCLDGYGEKYGDLQHQAVVSLLAALDTDDVKKYAAKYLYWHLREAKLELPPACRYVPGPGYAASRCKSQ